MKTSRSSIRLGKPFSKGEVELISKHLSADPQPVTAYRDGDLPLKFNGWLIGEASAEYARVDAMNRVFLTETGLLVVTTYGSSKDGSNEWFHASVATDAEAALGAWKEHTKGKLSRCALDAWDQACRTLPFMHAFRHVEV